MVIYTLFYIGAVYAIQNNIIEIYSIWSRERDCQKFNNLLER